MSIEDTGTVDIIGTKPDTNAVLLVITDHLPWHDPSEHKLLIQAKINTYLTFVESGQIHKVESPRIPAEPEVTIRLALKHQPPEEVVPFLKKAAKVLQDSGFDFVWKVG